MNSHIILFALAASFVYILILMGKIKALKYELEIEKICNKKMMLNLKRHLQTMIPYSSQIPHLSNLDLKYAQNVVKHYQTSIASDAKHGLLPNFSAPKLIPNFLISNAELISR